MCWIGSISLLVSCQNASDNSANEESAVIADDPRSFHHCILTPANIPAPVMHVILDSASKQAKNWFTVERWREAGLTCEHVFSPVRKLDAPDGLQLFVSERNFLFGASFDDFVLYDPRTDIATQSPPYIFTKWSKQGDGDGSTNVRFSADRSGMPNFLVATEKGHNGTMYDAIIDRYFEFGEDLALTPVLSIERETILLGDFEELTERRLTFASPFRARIDVRSRSKRGIGVSGSVELVRDRLGTPFRVVKPPAGNNKALDGLVSYCDTRKSDDQFIRDGCNFYY